MVCSYLASQIKKKKVNMNKCTKERKGRMYVRKKSGWMGREMPERQLSLKSTGCVGHGDSTIYSSLLRSTLSPPLSWINYSYHFLKTSSLCAQHITWSISSLHTHVHMHTHKWWDKYYLLFSYFAYCGKTVPCPDQLTCQRLILEEGLKSILI